MTLIGVGGGGAMLDVLSIMFMCGVTCGFRCAICWVLTTWDFCVLVWWVPISPIGGVGGGAMVLAVVLC